MQPQTGTRCRQERDNDRTIRLKDLHLVMASVKLRRWNHNDTCLLVALSESSLIQLDCHRRNVEPSHVENAIKMGKSPVRVSPMDRGHIAALIERVRWQRGLPEIRKTWGTGIRALLAEPKYVLNGGRAA